MNDAEFEAQKARIVALIAKWVEPLGLKMWRKVQFEYWREPLPEEHGDDHFQVLGRTYVKWQYRDAKVLFCLPLCEEQSDADLEYIFLHECCHILINEMRQCDQDDWIDHEEHAVTQLAQAFGWVREYGRRDAEAAKPKRRVREAVG